jgi:signal transduction histidine kinase
MKRLPAFGYSVVAMGSLLTIAASRARLNGERKNHAALKAAHAALEARTRALQARLDQLEPRALTVERERDQFLATLSHELRSPLNAILGWIELLRLHLREPAQQVHAIDIIERNARAEVRLVSDLLDMARLMTGRLRLVREKVPLQQVVDEAVEAVRSAAATKHISVQVDAQDAIEVDGDRVRLGQVMTQLLDNAVKFTSPRGRVVVTLTADPSNAVIRVTDTGIGISPDMIPCVFDRFRQAESGLTRSYGGLGIGLALVRSLVELHGGTVEAESPGLDRGSTFTVRLPRAGP